MNLNLNRIRLKKKTQLYQYQHISYITISTDKNSKISSVGLFIPKKREKSELFFFGGLTIILSLPLKTEATSSMNFSLWTREDASHTDPDTTKPFPLHSFKHLFSSVSFLEHVCTDAPNPASSSTTAWLTRPDHKQNKPNHIHQSTKGFNFNLNPPKKNKRKKKK